MNMMVFGKRYDFFLNSFFRRLTKRGQMEARKETQSNLRGPYETHLHPMFCSYTGTSLYPIVNFHAVQDSVTV